MTERFKHIIRVADLIAAELKGKISEVEQEELDRWKKDSPENMQLYEKYKAEEFLARKFEFTREHDWNEAYQDFTNRINWSIRRKRKFQLFYRYAGVAALIVLACGIFYFTRKDERQPLPVAQKIQPGVCKAILTEPDGTKVDISDTTFLAYVKKNIVTDATTKDSANGKTVLYHTITIPRGAEYALTLSDGSHLKMNSESEIRIPENFGQGGREIYMDGEIYFDVARDTSLPFVVHTFQGEVQVLGTSFNVRNYSDESFLEATLVSGKVAFKKEEETTCLNPGEQLRLNKENGKTVVETVDVWLYCSWKDGRFVFEMQRLEDIMNTISRWYNIYISYESQVVKDILFTGNIKRYEDLDQVIDMLKLMNKIDIEVKGNQVFIKSRE